PSCDDRDGHYIVVPGRDFTQRFKIRRLLGQGTFGKVMECEDAATGRLVAIKVIRAVSKYRDAAKIEIRVLQTLQRNDPTNVFHATFNNEYHSQVVSTRHYRAPEIILNLGWSFPCDMWSIGCIILELLTGEALFQTHDNNEHLAMMEVVVGQAPAHIVRSVAPDLRPKFFRSDGTARYPAPDQPRQSQKGLRAMRPLDQLVNPATNPIYANLHDLLYRLLQYDPRARITAKEACDHQFFRHRVGPDGRLANRPPPTPQHQQHSQAPAQQQQKQIHPTPADIRAGTSARS
ncbi:serine threonine protein kinase CMGC group, partial [Coemansia sp. RSA 2673]